MRTLITEYTFLQVHSCAGKPEKRCAMNEKGAVFTGFEIPDSNR